MLSSTIITVTVSSSGRHLGAGTFTGRVAGLKDKIDWILRVR